MENIVTIGKRLIPLSEIALIEAYDPATSKVTSDRPFKARIVRIDRESVLAEDTPESLAATHGFRVIEDESVAINPSVRFMVEHFAPAEDFKPKRAYRSRLVWRDQDGNTQSKLMLSEAEDLVVLVSGDAVRPPVESRKPVARRRRGLSRRAAAVAPGTGPA